MLAVMGPVMKRANRKPRLCVVEGCGRPARARGLCQTHYKHMRKHGETRQINPKRQGRDGTVRYAGLSLTSGCASAIDAVAKTQGVAPNAVITDIIEGWAKRQKPPPRGKPFQDSGKASPAGGKASPTGGKVAPTGGKASSTGGRASPASGKPSPSSGKPSKEKGRPSEKAGRSSKDRTRRE